MQQPSSASQETVTRPDPGLARGKWEAPVWAFYVALAVLVVGVAAYVTLRTSLLSRARRKRRESNA